MGNIAGGKCLSAARLDGKTAIITGANTGIGFETTKDFFKRGARVIMACRSLDRANAAANEIQQQCAGGEKLGRLEVTELDLSNLKSVRNCAKHLVDEEKRIDLLINNAGVMVCPYTKTADGFEMQFGTNHLGHFLFTLLLLPKIVKSIPARIVNVSSLAHERGNLNFDDLNWEKNKYSAVGAYQASKLANVLFTKELERKLSAANIKGVNVYSLHPGIIPTELGRHLDETYFRGARATMGVIMRLFSKTPLQGAQTTIYCAVDEKCANESGLYYSDCAVKVPSKQAQSVEDGERLWEESLALVGLAKDYNPFITK